MGIHERYRPEKKSTPAAIALRLVVAALIVSACIRLFLFETVVLRGPEMLPGAARGDVLLLNRFATGIRLPLFNNVSLFGFYTPETGDLAVIKHPWRAWSGVAEFFDTCTASLFGLTGNGELRLVRVMAREGQKIRIDASGIVHVGGTKLDRQKSGTLSLHNRAAGGDEILRRQIVRRMLVSEDSIKGKPMPDLTLPLWREGKWEVAQSEGESADSSMRTFPLPVTNDAQAATWARRWLANTVLQSDDAPVAVLHERDNATGPALVRDAAGNLWFRLDDSTLEPLIRIESGLAWLVIPRGMIFVLNDMRDALDDSRTWGPVYEKTITGIPMLRIWPMGRFDSLD